VRTLTVTGAKGGTAKTTTAITLAAELAALGYRVMLRDLDPQASATLALGVEPSADPWQGEPVALPLGVLPGAVWLYPGGRAITSGAERDAREWLRMADFAADFQVVDCPPSLDALTLAALEAATVALVPLRPSPLDLPAFRDVAALVEGLENPPQLRAVLTQVHTRRLLTRDVAEYLNENAPGSLYAAQIPEDVKAAEAPGYATPVTLYAPSSRAAEAYRELAREVAADLNGGRA